MKTKILTTLLFLVLTLSPAIANSPTYTVSVNVSWTELTEHEVYSLRNHLNEFLKKADKKTSSFNLRVNKERQ
jgi:hypothetical protein